MKVLRGRISDAEREILYESNRTGKRVLVATLHGCVERDPGGEVGCQEPMQAVGVCTGWSHDSFKLGGFSFQTNIPWLEAVRVYWRDDAPSKEELDAFLAEQLELREADRDAAFVIWAFLKGDDPEHTDEERASIVAARERVRQAVWAQLGLSITELEKHGRRNVERILQGVGQ